MKRILSFLSCFFLLMPSAFAVPTGRQAGWNKTRWSQLQSGLEYSNFKVPVDNLGFANLHAFRIDPKYFTLRVFQANPKEKLGESVDEIVKASPALIAVNGGFFTEEHRSLGLLIDQGKILNRIHNTSWWSIFTISKTGTARIFSPKLYAESNNQLDFAVQAGPRLVISGEIPEFRDFYADRTALGITTDGKIVLVVTEGSGLLLQQLAQVFSEDENRGGLNCLDAMALDGGSSSQLYTHLPNFKAHVTSAATVTNAVAVVPR